MEQDLIQLIKSAAIMHPLHEQNVSPFKFPDETIALKKLIRQQQTKASMQ